jgi:DNA anti-recombination protein RmuC
MESQTVMLMVVLLLGFITAISYYLVSQMKKIKDESKGKEDDVLVQWLKEMKASVEKNSDVLERQLKDQRNTLDQQMQSQREAMSQQTKLIWERMDTSSEVIRSVQKQLGGLQEFGTDMKDLSNILKSPKLRGGLGEQFLY